MLLQSLEIKNYRSLESVKLDHLTHINVLIGRHNSGKSSIFGALALLNSALRGQYSEWDTVLTGMEASRSLELTLVFSIRPQERGVLQDGVARSTRGELPGTSSK